MNKLGLKLKVALMLGTVLAALVFMAMSSLVQERSLILESRREQLATAVQSAYSIVSAYQAKAASGAMTQDDAQKAAKDALRLSRYGGPEGKTEYFYIWIQTISINSQAPLRSRISPKLRVICRADCQWRYITFGFYKVISQTV